MAANNWGFGNEDQVHPGWFEVWRPGVGLVRRLHGVRMGKQVHMFAIPVASDVYVQTTLHSSVSWPLKWRGESMADANVCPWISVARFQHCLCILFWGYHADASLTCPAETHRLCPSIPWKEMGCCNLSSYDEMIFLLAGIAVLKPNHAQMWIPQSWVPVCVLGRIKWWSVFWTPPFVCFHIQMFSCWGGTLTACWKIRRKAWHVSFLHVGCGCVSHEEHSEWQPTPAAVYQTKLIQSQKSFITWMVRKKMGFQNFLFGVLILLECLGSVVDMWILVTLESHPKAKNKIKSFYFSTSLNSVYLYLSVFQIHFSCREFCIANEIHLILQYDFTVAVF